MTNDQTLQSAVRLRTVCWQTGAGDTDEPVLVFLHGLGDGADIWHPVINAWPGTRNFKAVAFDLPGHGGSDWMESGGYSASAIVDAVTDTLMENQIDRPILIGHSLGARVALEIAADGLVAPLLTVLIDMNPEAISGEPSDAQLSVADHIDALITGANSIDEFVRILKDRLPQSDLDTLDTVTRALLSAHPRPSASRVAMPLDPEIRSLVTTVLRTDAWSLLGEAMSPVAIVRGEFSGVLDRRTALRMTKEVIRCVADETIRRAGHAIALEQPKALADVLARIVSQRLAAFS